MRSLAIATRARTTRARTARTRTALAVALPVNVEAQPVAIIRDSNGKLVERVSISDFQARQSVTNAPIQSGRARQMLDSSKVERSADPVRTLPADVDTLRVRLGDQLGLPRVRGLDSVGIIVLAFVALGSYTRRLVVYAMNIPSSLACVGLWPAFARGDSAAVVQRSRKR